MFKKIHLLFLATFFATNMFAQDFVLNPFKEYQNLDAPFAIVKNAKRSSINSTTLKLVPFWSDNFDTPGDWVIGTLDSASAGSWRIDSLGPVGQFSSQMNSISSNSGGNFAIFDSDDESYSNNFPDAVLTTASPINCSSHSMVRLTFNSYYSFYSYNEIYLEISSDNVNWNSIRIHPNEVAGIYTDNPEQISINISPYAANQPQVWLRFRHKGEWEYAWMIDDLELEDLPVTDATIVDAHFTGDDFVTRPLSQLYNNISLNADNLNFGGTNISPSIKAIVIDSIGTTVFNASAIGGIINPGDTMNMTIPATLSSSAIPASEYQIQFISNVIGDVNLSNDTLTKQMNVSDSMLIRTPNLTTYNFGWNGGLSHAERFELINSDTLSGVQAWLRFSDTLGAINTIVGMQLQMEIWESLNDTPSVKVADCVPYTVLASDTVGNSGDTSFYPIYFKVDSGYLGGTFNSGVYLDSGSYYMVLKEPSNSPALAMPMMSYEYTAKGNTFAKLSNGLWFDYTDYVDESAASLFYNYSLAMSAILSQPTRPQICSLTVSAVATNTSGPLAYDGSATATATNGASPYTYSWSNGGNTSTINNINIGNYYVVVSDTLGCRDTAFITVFDSCQMYISGVVTDATAPNASDGSIDLTVSNGVVFTSFQWSNSAVTEDINFLSQGIYSITVTDSVGCIDSASFVVNAANCNLNVSTQVTNESSPGANDGSASASASGGNPLYDYTWSNGISASSINNLAPGPYSVTVTDSLGCLGYDTVFVNSFVCTGLYIDSVVVNNTSGPTGTDGSIEVYPLGTPGAFSYAWSNGQTSNILMNVDSGVYCVTITDDSLGCQIDTCILVGNDPCNFTLASTVVHETAPGANNGSISLSGVNGVAPYTFAWSPNVSNTDSISTNLSPGVYSYTITDASGCVATGFDTIIAFCQLSVSGIVLNTIPNQSNGSIDITVIGGFPPYTFLWTPGGMTTEDISGLDIGNYNVQVQDSLGCITNALLGVEAHPNSIIELTEERFMIYPNPTNGMINVQLNDQNSVDIYYLNIRNMLGELLTSETRLFSNEAFSYDLSLLQSGLYIIEISNKKEYLSTYPVILK
jgi:hypothetical protein